MRMTLHGCFTRIHCAYRSMTHSLFAVCLLQLCTWRHTRWRRPWPKRTWKFKDKQGPFTVPFIHFFNLLSHKSHTIVKVLWNFALNQTLFAIKSDLSYFFRVLCDAVRRHRRKNHQTRAQISALARWYSYSVSTHLKNQNLIQLETIMGFLGRSLFFENWTI